MVIVSVLPLRMTSTFLASAILRIISPDNVVNSFPSAFMGISPSSNPALCAVSLNDNPALAFFKGR